MKKVVFPILGAAAIAAGAVFNFSTGINNGVKDDVALANVEALAHGEVDLGRGCVHTLPLLCVWPDGYYVQGVWAY
jgi:hypothetical protein